MRLHNTLTRQVEPFEPLDPNEVRIYTCGPTVYDYATIGNLRAYLFADILRRTLEYTGYRVKHVMNITDVGHLESDADEGEDKMLKGVRRERKTPWEIAGYYTEVFFSHSEALNILRPHIVCRATEHIPEMIDFVRRLEQLGYTYQISDGVYFDISKNPRYGQLSGLDLEGQRAGARVDVNLEKRHPADFALWRLAAPEHIMQWDSPWGRGYPGWHIECSAMSTKYLGDRFDIHTGGVDHIPVHHEDELAQNDCALGHRVVSRWMHNEFLLVDGGRMGKSLGNFYTVDNLVMRGFHPLAYRYLVLNAHYRSKLNFTWEALGGAQTALDRLWQRVRSLALATGNAGTAGAAAALPGAADESPEALRFAELIGDDLGTPQAMSVLWEVARGDRDPGGALELMLLFDRVLGIGLDAAARGQLGAHSAGTDVETPEVLALLQQREDARAARDWGRADQIRARLLEMGVAVEDTPSGPKVRPRPA
ncbi:MAG: cysteine--tRNA ligase [Bacillota bacterium]|nr:cysteine--tRNA ligase [Bacillota bacterium]